MNNKCEVCGSEMMIDHMDSEGRVFYVCMNKTCPRFRQSFNPISGDVTVSEILEAKKADDPPKEPTQPGASQ